MASSVLAVFDIDGTLTDSIAQHQSAFESALRSFDFPDLRTNWSSYRHHTDSAIFAEAWQEAGWDSAPDQEKLESRFAAAFDANLMNWPIRETPGASALLTTLERHNIPFGFATGSLKHGAMRKLSVLTAATDAQPLTTASEFETREAIVGKAIEAAHRMFELAPDTRVVSIGDGLWDLKTAAALGLDFIGVGTGLNAEKLRAEGAEVVEDFCDIDAVLNRIGVST